LGVFAGSDLLASGLAGAAVTLAGVRARFGSVARAALVAALVILALPPFVRASWRNVKTVANDTERIELDLFVERHMQRYESFAILEDALSGRSNPRLGRFNLEGIYREMLRYKLRSVKDLGQFEPRQKELVLVREESLGRLPSGWREVQRVQPFFARPWTLVGVEYEF
jgi:hypothetical protein